MEEEEKVGVYQSFEQFIKGVPNMMDFYRSCPVLVYMIYGAGGQMVVEGAADVSIKECLARILKDIDMANKPTAEEVLEDETGELAMKFNDMLAPWVLLEMIKQIETADTASTTIH